MEILKIIISTPNFTKFLNPYENFSALFYLYSNLSYEAPASPTRLRYPFYSKRALSRAKTEVYTLKIKTVLPMEILKFLFSFPNFTKFLNPQDFCSAQNPRVAI